MSANMEKHGDPVVPEKAGRLMPPDPLGINSSPEEVKQKFMLDHFTPPRVTISAGGVTPERVGTALS